MTALALSQEPVSIGKDTPKPHLTYLDSVRGLAALVVVLHHAYGFAFGAREAGLPHVLVALYHKFLYAHYAVDVFIVLSGYCLMIPVAKSGTQRLVGGFRQYLQRRARRILPPYYAALGLSLLGIAFVRLWQVWGHPETETSTLGSVPGLIAHLLLVHNLSSAWEGGINPVLWSVATEWQIYFVFPLLLLPLWRRCGMALTWAICVLLTTGPYLISHSHTLEGACPWYVSLFAAGMGAALVNFSGAAWAVRLRSRLPWRVLPVLLGIAALVALHMFSGMQAHWIEDPVLGLLVAGFLAYATQTLTNKTSPQKDSSGARVLALLNAAPLVRLGSFSYSLYLMHHPILTLLRAILPVGGLSPTVQFVAVVPFEILVTVGLCYGFYCAFERRFVLPRRRSAIDQPEAIAAVGSPAI